MCLAWGWMAVASCSAPDGADPEVVTAGDEADVRTPELATYSEPPLRLVSSALLHDPMLGIPARLAIRDSLLIVTDLGGEPFLHGYHLGPDQKLRAIGRRGQGPGEFGATPWPVPGAGGDDASTWYFDGVLRRLTAVPANRFYSAELGAEPIHTQSTVPVGPGVRKPGWLPDGSLVSAESADSLEGLTLLRYAVDGTLISATPGLVRDDRFDNRDLQSAYDYFLCASPDGRRLAVVYFFAGMGSVLDSVGNVSDTLSAPIVFRPTAIRHPLTRRTTFKGGEGIVRQAYIDCAATDSTVYALFLGRLNSATIGRSGGRRAFVHAFRWDGSLVGAFELDHGAHALAVDLINRRLVTATLGEDGASPELRVLPLPAIE